MLFITSTFGATKELYSVHFIPPPCETFFDGTQRDFNMFSTLTIGR